MFKNIPKLFSFYFKNKCLYSDTAKYAYLFLFRGLPCNHVCEHTMSTLEDSTSFVGNILVVQDTNNYKVTLLSSDKQVNLVASHGHLEMPLLNIYTNQNKHE